MFLGRLIRATGFTKLSIIRTTWLTKIFVAGDILCFLVQAVGATILTTADDQDGLDRGRAVILVGLALQLVIFGLFVLVALVFHVRVRRGGLRDKAMCNWNWETYLNLLYLVSVIITLRNVYRVVEYVQGSEGYLMTHEWSIYIFDALLMAIVLAITASWYLGKIVAPKEIQQDYEMVAGDRGTAAVPLI
ncbi:hypothetical protein EJ04DRAFT_513717 [Polyplosphaeria fusca]|uniref:Uncharacterized protein n=1 Tax=Polyplosphaeria fusca TaxID=682080 RepID=A0A9P4QWW0_9PLEO|nr:hypothetical protein EJ04DRAFT_513717 [Polyplosphaeria fusca]